MEFFKNSLAKLVYTNIFEITIPSIYEDSVHSTC